MEGDLVAALRAAGCVFAEEEAALLLDAAAGGEDLQELLARRVAGEPLEHIVGWVGFGGLRLSVGPGVFVPRQRTLLLARVAAALVREHGARVAVEAMSGVAPVAATLARDFPGLDVHACDVSPEAVRHARRNLPGGQAHVGAGLGGLPERLRGGVDVCAAVPPYVPEPEAHVLPHDVLSHEPRRALLAGLDGLEAARALLDEARSWLAPAGVLALEMSRDQAEGALAEGAARGYRREAVHTSEDRTAVVVLALGRAAHLDE